MAVVLALITSTLWGTSDFFGGLATRRDPVARVMLWAHGMGLLAIAIAAPFLAGSVSAKDLAIGALAGVVGLLGLVLLYDLLSTGPMAVVAPLSALTAAVVPITWGLGSDEPTSGITLAGLAIGLAAVLAISWEGGTVDAPVTARIVISAVVAGVCFGSIVLLYDATSSDSAPWPIVSGRVVTFAMLLGFALWRRGPLKPVGSLRFAAIAGIGDTAANLTLLLATSAAVTSNELSVVAVITAFFPAATVIWARIVLDERMGPVRIAGLGLGLGAVVLMTLG